MQLRLKYPLIVIVALFASVSPANTLTLTVTEPSGVKRTSWPVTSGIPLPQGGLNNPSNVKLLQNGTELPLQTETLCKWPDGSIRWLLLDFQVDLKAKERKQFTLQYSPKVKSKEVKNPVRVSTKGSNIEVVTGPMRMVLTSASVRPLDAVWLDVNKDGVFSSAERVTNSNGAGIVLQTPDGKRFRADLTKADVAIEQAGPLRACIRFEGKHASAKGAMFRYVLRIHAFRGKDFVRMFYTFINDYQDELMAKIDSLDFIFSLDGKTTGNGILAGKKVKQGRLFQVDEKRYEIDGKPAGERSLGWAAIEGDRSGLAVGLRQFWQNWPKAIECREGKLTVGICPQFPKGLYDNKPLEEENKLYYYLRDGVYTFKIGMARTHELWAMFFSGRSKTSELNNFFLSAEQPLLAVCEPAYACSTKAFGDCPPADANKYEGYDGWLDRTMDAHLKLREKQREFGMLNYGDWFGERSVNWGNLEYEMQYGLLIQHLRTGDRKYYLRAEQAARHHIDVDVVHAVNKHVPSDPRRGDVPQLGDVWRHSLNHTGGYFEDGVIDIPETNPIAVKRYREGTTEFGHVWVAGDFLYYFLTGDRRALEVSTLVGNATASDCPTPYSSHMREIGWPMIVVLAAYEATGDKKYLDAATRNWQVLKKNLDPQRGWVVHIHAGHCKHGDRRCYGNVTYCEGIVLCALAQYHRITKDPEVLKAMSIAVEQLIRESWLEDAGTFRYCACPLSKVHPILFLLCAEGMAYEAALTQNAEHKRILCKALHNGIPKGDNDTGTALGMFTRFTPFALTVLEQ